MEAPPDTVSALAPEAPSPDAYTGLRQAELLISAVTPARSQCRPQTARHETLCRSNAVPLSTTTAKGVRCMRASAGAPSGFYPVGDWSIKGGLCVVESRRLPGKHGDVPISEGGYLGSGRDSICST